jgi:hypothetical protein
LITNTRIEKLIQDVKKSVGKSLGKKKGHGYVSMWTKLKAKGRPFIKEITQNEINNALKLLATSF